MIESSAIVETNNIGTNVSIGHFSVIRHGVILGDNITIHSNVIIESGVVIGSNVEIFPGTYIGKIPKGNSKISRKLMYKSQIFIDENCLIGPNVVIYYDVHIGKSTLIGDNSSIRENVSIGDLCIIGRGVTINDSTRIGNRTKILDLTHITGNCEIGDDVFISVSVTTTNDNLFGKLGYGKHVSGPKICNEVAIGAGANILPGVRIGEGAIVAASSVVTKDVPDYQMVAGYPARPVKKLNNIKC